MKTVATDQGLVCGRCQGPIPEGKLNCPECCWAISIEFRRVFDWSARLSTMIREREAEIAHRQRASNGRKSDRIGPTVASRNVLV